MNRKWILLVGAADLFILSLLDKIAFRYFLYWKYSWFDILMHLGGGFAIGLLSSWAYLEVSSRDESIKELKWKEVFVYNLSFAVVIGVIWEIFELFADRIVVFTWFDTGKDVIIGIIGSLLAGYIIGLFKLWPKQKNLN